MKAHKVLPERAPLDMPRHRVNERGHTLRQHSPSFFILQYSFVTFIYFISNSRPICLRDKRNAWRAQHQ